MAKYTFTLRELISTFGEEKVKSWFMDYDLTDYLTAEEINVINEKGTWSKEQLASRIVTHFMLREIGQDSVGAFKLMAKDLMSELMETYAPLIYSASIKFDPLVNVNFTEELDRTTGNTSTSKTSSTGDGSSLDIRSDTPQGQLNKSDILEGKYASETQANESNSNTKGEATSNDNGNEHYLRTTKGNSGVSATSQKMIEQYRDIIRALNTEIVYQLEPLFMGLY